MLLVAAWAAFQFRRREGVARAPIFRKSLLFVMGQPIYGKALRCV